MKLSDLFETDHSYESPLSHRTDFQPIRQGDTFRVFHGFRDLKNALDVCRNGTSGKLKADRAYSFEFDNNPSGLFVTLDFKVAAEFGATIIEFKANLDELEAPVWPGGGYAVQGQKTEYFGNGMDGRRNRNDRKKTSEEETESDARKRPDDFRHIADSDPGNRYMAQLLTASREYQALFIGHINPSRIVSVYTRDQNTTNSTYTKHAIEDFLGLHSDKPTKPDRRMFLPQDDFNGDEFIRRMSQEFGKDVSNSYVNHIRLQVA